ncbi:hypothetical protein CEXT_609821 [Caerostris extrusa]|uniref:Uncharacterized protein n=1 Tax=Caerostris extrusa TaxID=172846 RepID=A0AAV4XMK5_CAEEX|nr:hypothetical protein CEXT_609821 [Caerostris extrusa]
MQKTSLSHLLNRAAIHSWLRDSIVNAFQCDREKACTVIEPTPHKRTDILSAPARYPAKQMSRQSSGTAHYWRRGDLPDTLDKEIGRS